MNVYYRDVIGSFISRFITHELNRLRCHGNPFYTMIDLQLIDLQLSSFDLSSLCQCRQYLFTFCLPNNGKHVLCLRVRRVAISQRQRLVGLASPSIGFRRMPSAFCGSTTLICKLICLVETYHACGKHLNIRGVGLRQRRVTRLDWHASSVGAVATHR